MKNIVRHILLKFKYLKNIGLKWISSIIFIIRKYPIRNFIAVFLTLFLLIVIGNFLRKPKAQPKVPVPPKTVTLYHIGGAPKVRVQAQIQKSGVITIVAQTPGVVHAIPVTEGQRVTKGNQLVSLASNYYGGNAAVLQRQLAQKQYQQINDTFNLQTDLIGKQKELAQKNQDNTDQLRDITSKSIDETQSLLALNEDILATLDQNLQAYQATNSAGLNNTLILSTKQLKSQFLAAVNQLRGSLRSIQYQSDTSKPPTQLTQLSKDIAIKQLDIQLKTLELTREISQIQLNLARVQEAMMFPAAPFTSTVERIYVRVGQAVSPGSPLVSISAYGDDPLTVVATLPENLARQVSRLEASVIHIPTAPLSMTPRFISNDATHGQLYSVIYDIPDYLANKLTDNNYVQVDIPIGYPDTGSTLPFIPLDSVFETQEHTYVFVLQVNKAEAKDVVLGNVYGRFVQVTSGLTSKDEVILDRSVISGEEVRVNKN